MLRTLLLCAPAPVKDEPGGYRLDVKFVEGMRAHQAHWGGRINCVLWRTTNAIPFGRHFDRDELGFDLTVLDENDPVPQELISAMDVASISADMVDVDDIVARANLANVPVVLTLEYTFRIRAKIALLERSISFPRRLNSIRWQAGHELRVRKALKGAAGAQFNGYPAFDTYSEKVGRPMLYLDNRMKPELFATPQQMDERAAYLHAKNPLRLIHSGRLEYMKGAHQLLPVMRELRRLKVDATLDIFGTGSLEGEIRAGLAEFGGAVRLYSPVDFETCLVPFSVEQADIFVGTHLQSDPSCSYVEALGCGLALAGYKNKMWSRLSAEAGCGKSAPMGNPKALAAVIAQWDANRTDLVNAQRTGLAFARKHDFDTEFARRMEHIRLCASL
ncbi:MAG: glycosyltransferase [Paracoccaceae bacterium]